MAAVLFGIQFDDAQETIPRAASVREISRASWDSVRLCHTHRKLHQGINTTRPDTA